MREQALALRRRPFERASEELFEVTLGRDLQRLLPPELLALHHPVLLGTADDLKGIITAITKIHRHYRSIVVGTGSARL